MAGVVSSPLRSRFTTDDFDEASEVLAAAYGEHAPVLRGAPEDFVYDATSVEVDGLRVEHFDFGSQVASRYRPFEDMLLVGWLRRGGFRLDDGQQERALGPGELVWFRPDRPLHVVTDDVSFDFTRLDLATLQRVAAEMTGVEGATLRFHSGPPMSAAMTRYWVATRRYVDDHVLGDRTLDVGPLVQREALTALARATLLAIPNTAADLLADPDRPAPGGEEPSTVRRAIAFMDAHAQDDIDITRIAHASGLGARGLQAAFRRHRDQTPLEYLRRVRMDHAHRDLQAADPTRGDSVAAIAARWGFAHPGRFAVEYRRTYGRPPSGTLRG